MCDGLASSITRRAFSAVTQVEYMYFMSYTLGT